MYRKKRESKNEPRLTELSKRADVRKPKYKTQ